MRLKWMIFFISDIHRACHSLMELDWRQVEAVDARMELDLRIGAAFTRFQTLNFRDKYTELKEKVISYGNQTEKYLFLI